jgi:hypothetical protein
MDIKGLTFECTCSAYPEQYDVFDDNNNLVGYVRLRWGILRCEYPDVGGKEIYYAYVGDSLCGFFENENQRMEHLNNIADKILEVINEPDEGGFNMYLYHGSNKCIEGDIIPHKSFHYEPLVYATSDLRYALVRAGKFDVNQFLLKEDYDGLTFTFIELKENAIEEAFDTDGYIYILDGRDFFTTVDCMANEFITEKSCGIFRTWYIDNVLNRMKELNQGGYYKFIRYGSEEEQEYWNGVRGGKEGYLQRRQERINKLKGL